MRSGGPAPGWMLVLGVALSCGQSTQSSEVSAGLASSQPSAAPVVAPSSSADDRVAQYATHLESLRGVTVDGAMVEPRTSSPQLLASFVLPRVCRFTPDLRQVACRELGQRSGDSPTVKLVPVEQDARWLVLAKPAGSRSPPALFDTDRALGSLVYQPKAEDTQASVDAQGYVRVLDLLTLARSADGTGWDRVMVPVPPGRSAPKLLGDWLLFQSRARSEGGTLTELTVRRVRPPGQPALGPEITPGKVPHEIKASCWDHGHLAVSFGCEGCERGKLAILADDGVVLHDVDKGPTRLTCTAEGATLSLVRTMTRNTLERPTVEPVEQPVYVQEERCTVQGCTREAVDLVLRPRNRGAVSSVPLGDKTLLVWTEEVSGTYVSGMSFSGTLLHAPIGARPFMRLAPLAELALAPDRQLLAPGGGRGLVEAYPFARGDAAIVLLFSGEIYRHVPEGTHWLSGAALSAVRVSSDGKVDGVERYEEPE